MAFRRKQRISPLSFVFYLQTSCGEEIPKYNWNLEIKFPSCHNVFDCLKVQKFEIFQDQVLGMLSLQEPFWGRHDSGFKNDITHHHQLRNKPEKYCNVSKIFFHVILFKISIWKSRHGQWINQPTALAVATALLCSIYFNIYLITSPLS